MYLMTAGGGIDWARYSDYTAVVVIDAEQAKQGCAMDRFHKLWEAQLDR